MVQMQSREVKYLPVSTLHSLWSIPLDIFASYDWDIKDNLTISSFKSDEKKLLLWLKISSEESGIFGDFKVKQNAKARILHWSSIFILKNPIFWKVKKVIVWNLNLNFRYKFCIFLYLYENNKITVNFWFWMMY